MAHKNPVMEYNKMYLYSWMLVQIAYQHSVASWAVGLILCYVPYILQSRKHI